jgi:low affinity Fe/Cu permease
MPKDIKKNLPRPPEDFATKITSWVGSTTSLYVHTIFFIVVFILPIFGMSISTTLLVLTTAVSLEAIYLSILIQLTVNRNTQSLQEVEEDIDEIQADVDEIQEDVDEIQKDVDEIEKDVDEIQVDVDGIEKDVDSFHTKNTHDALGSIEQKIQSIVEDLEALKKNRGN